MPSRNILGIRELGSYAIRLGHEGARHVPRRQTRHEPDTGVWEWLNNADFKPVEFDGIRMKAGLNSFALTLRQWTEKSGEVTCHGRGPAATDPEQAYYPQVSVLVSVVRPPLHTLLSEIVGDAG